MLKQKLLNQTADGNADTAVPSSRLSFLSYQFDVIAHLVVRNFLLRYRGSALGVLWSLLVPLSQLLVLTFIFVKVVSLKIEAYPAFLFIGILPWNWFSTCVTSAGSLFIQNRDLVLKPNFIPSNLIVVDVFTNLLTFLILLPLLFLLLIVYQRQVTIYLLMVPLLLLIQSLLITGIGLIISTLNILYRDIQHMVNIAVILLFYLTPIFYRTAMLDKKYHFIYNLNPMAVLVESYRATFFYGASPEWGSLLYVTIISLLTCLAGYKVYQRLLPQIFDHI
ncbi:MAG: ABC transporter permease [Desulfobacteraceae bacterium]